MSSVYLNFLMFLPAILIPVCASSSLGFCLMYSAYKLNKQGDNIQPYHIPFPIWNQSIVPCPSLTVASWPAYRFLKSQVRWSGIPISSRIFHSLLWSTQSKTLRNLMLIDLFLSFFYSLHSWNKFHLAIHIVLFATGFYLSIFGFKFPHSYP